MLPEPGDNVSIEAQRQLLFDRPIEQAAVGAQTRRIEIGTAAIDMR